MKKLNYLAIASFVFIAACQSSGDKANSTDSSNNTNEIAEQRQPEADSNMTNIGTENSSGAPATEYEKGNQLIAQSDCLTCHKVSEKLVGPAYVEIAKKYNGDTGKADYLAGKIIKGGAGVWGEVPMTPHPGLSEDDAKEMAKYVLSLNK